MPGKKAPDEDSVRSGSPAPGSALPGRVLSFLDRYFLSLSKRQRSVAYFVLLGLFCATTWRLLAGWYVVHGVIWNGDDYATMCEVHLGEGLFSTNSNGMYYAVLTPSKYYRSLARKQIDLPIVCQTKEGRMKPLKGPYLVRLNGWDDEFSPIHLEAPAKNPEVGQASPQFSFSFSAAAFAQAPPTPAPRLAPASPKLTGLAQRTPLFLYPSAGDRLVVERLQLGDAAKSMRKVEFEIDLGKHDQPLLLGGAEAGKVPLKSKVSFGDSYYFDVPQAQRGQDVSIEMDATGWFGLEEEFEFKLPTQYNQPIVVKGSLGSAMEIRLAPRASAPNGG